jgi:hypothetical protein
VVSSHGKGDGARPEPGARQADQTAANLLDMARIEVRKMHMRLQGRRSELAEGFDRAKTDGEGWAERRESFEAWAGTYSVSMGDVASFLRFEA